MAITAAQVKELREMTGAGMMDCKKALTATEGDMDKAVEFLREKGLATAQKKASRVAAEGLCKTLVSEDGKKAVVVEVNAETDFVAQNAEFKKFVSDVAKQVALNNPADVEALLQKTTSSDKIGVQAGTTAQYYIEGSDDWDFAGLPAECVQYKNGSLAVQDLVNGNLKYVIIDAAPATCITEAINAMQ